MDGDCLFQGGDGITPHVGVLGAGCVWCNLLSTAILGARVDSCIFEGKLSG